MPFATECPGCSTRMSAEDQHLGKDILCPKCGQVFVVSPLAAGDSEARIEASAATPQPAAKPVASPTDDKARSKRMMLLIGIGGLLTILAGVVLGAAVWLLQPPSNEQQHPAIASSRSFNNKSRSTKDAGPAESVRTAAEAANEIEALKAATVYIEVKSGEKTSTGSGLFAHKEKIAGTVITNSHVIGSLESLQEVTCVFDSGQPYELRTEGFVTYFDPQHDLAVIRVRDEQLPEPMRWHTPSKLRETMSVMTLGFPPGDDLATNSSGPAITESKGSIASILRDEYHNDSLIHIEGGIHAGNSGGPVVTENGDLVGIAVAKVRGEDNSFAIPQRLRWKAVFRKSKSNRPRRANRESTIRLTSRSSTPTRW